jgi:hypothetical protein
VELLRLLPSEIRASFLELVPWLFSWVRRIMRCVSSDPVRRVACSLSCDAVMILSSKKYHVNFFRSYDFVWPSDSACKVVSFFNALRS